MDNFYYIDKPIGITSFDVIRQLRKKFQIKKMWHTGTLDPLATGGLLIATGNYTKLIPYFEKAYKEYEFTIQLWSVSESLDLATNIETISPDELERYKQTITRESIEGLLRTYFTWEIEQIPPKYSALKINGKRALDRILAGEEFDMKMRKVIIRNIELLSFNFPFVTLRADVSAWTYIRTIAWDLWGMLGCGWVVTKLRRTKVGQLSINKWENLENIDISQYLHIYDILKQENFIQLAQEDIVELNFWRIIFKKYDFTQNIDLFVLWENHKITHIVRYTEKWLEPVRKI